MSVALALQPLPAASGLAELARVLAAHHLPEDDLARPGRSFYRGVACDGTIVGYGGLEFHGEAALLRSLVVVPPHRGQGFGHALVAALLDRAQAAGAREVYLLTTTAAAFFEGLGFARVERETACPAILATEQATHLCPASAPLLVRPVDADAITIYHNPGCGTSRNVLALIRNAGDEPRIIEYLKTPPTRAELINLVARMAIPVRGALRRKGTPYDELGLGDPALSDAAILDAMMAHPILINRPIVVTARGVKLCRPSEVVLDILPHPQRGAFRKEDGEPVVDDAGRRVTVPAATR